MTGFTPGLVERLIRIADNTTHHHIDVTCRDAASGIAELTQTLAATEKRVHDLERDCDSYAKTMAVIAELPPEGRIAELTAENERLRTALQQIHDLAAGLINDIDAEEIAA